MNKNKKIIIIILPKTRQSVVIDPLLPPIDYPQVIISNTLDKKIKVTIQYE